MIEITTINDTKQFAISTRLLMQEALRKGYELSFFPSTPSAQTGITRATKKGREIYFKSTCTLLTPSYGYFAAEDKVLTYSLLSSFGINTPQTEALKYDEPVEKLIAFLNTHKTVVVKPVNMNHGDGVSVGVNSETKLKKAVRFARESGNRQTDVIIQKQVTGEEYRFLVVDGKVVAVASRRPPFVVGDGVSTIRELIAEKNKDPRRGTGHSAELTLLDTDQVAQSRGNKFLDKVVDAGTEVNVLDTTNLSKGGESVDVTDAASSAIKKLAVDAAGACFLGVAGVDIMTPDIAAESADDSYVIEVNLTPGIRMHQFPSVGQSRDVAKLIFKAIEKTSQPIAKKVIKIGRVEQVRLKGYSDTALPARIDTGATISSIWASDISEVGGKLTFKLLGEKSRLFSGKVITATKYGQRVIASSTGHIQTRYVVKMPVQIKGRTVSARFTLADRSTQTYPVLIGRNVLRNNFLVDVYGGKKDLIAERKRRAELDKKLHERSS